jgi:hypothetical protein
MDGEFATAILLLMFLINGEDHLHFHGRHDLSVKPEVDIVDEGGLHILEFQCSWIMDLRGEDCNRLALFSFYCTQQVKDFLCFVCYQDLLRLEI